MNRSALIVTSVVLTSMTMAACSDDGREMRVPQPGQNESIITTTVASTEPVGFDTAGLPSEAMQISTSWAEGERIPVQFTCSGAGHSPNVSWFDTPVDAVGIAIVFYELVAGSATQITHWVVANLDPLQAYIDVGEFEKPDIETNFDVVFGLNDPIAGSGTTIGYRAPCPAPGTSATFVLEVHALGQFIELPSGTPARDLRTAIDSVTISSASITAFAQG